MKLPKGLKFKRTDAVWSGVAFISKTELGVGDKIPCGWVITEIIEREKMYLIRTKGIIEANNDWVEDEKVKVNFQANKTYENLPNL